MVKVSVIVPVKNDKRIFNLIDALEKQTFKDFEVLIADDSEKRLFDRETTLNLKYFHLKGKGNGSVSNRIHFLAKKASSDIIAVTESDCLPSKTWLEDLLSEYEDDKTVVVGVQNLLSPYVTIFSFGSLLLPKKAFNVPFDKTIRRGEDTDWFYSLKEKGFKFKQINKAVVIHYKDPVKRLFRSFDYARDNAYIYIKHNQDKRIIKSIIFQFATIFFSFVTIFTLAFYGLYYKLRKILFKKIR